MIIAKLLYKTPDTLNALSISFLIMITYNPFVIYDMGLILSYGGTIGILLFANLFKKTKNKILNIAIVSLSAQIVLMPIIAYFYCTLHPTFFVSNIIATPIFEMTILIGFVFTFVSFIFPPLCFLLKFPLEICTTALIKIANISSNLPFAEINIIRPNIYEIIIYYMIAIIFVIPTKISKKKVICILLCILLIIQIPKFLPTTFCIYFVDVGQGDCTLIQTVNHKTIMIDSGGSENIEEYDIGKKVLVPYLLARGVYKLDFIMISHFHADHCNRICWSNGRDKSGNIING